jgi:hypothetical protein
MGEVPGLICPWGPWFLSTALSTVRIRFSRSNLTALHKTHVVRNESVIHSQRVNNSVLDLFGCNRPHPGSPSLHPRERGLKYTCLRFRPVAKYPRLISSGLLQTLSIFFPPHYVLLLRFLSWNRGSSAFRLTSRRHNAPGVFTDTNL